MWAPSIVASSIWGLQHLLHHGGLAQRRIHIGALPAVIDDEEPGWRAARYQAPQPLMQPCSASNAKISVGSCFHVGSQWNR